jgi:prepilin-type N-terminal cleavage/methylation domain-containing protein
MSGTGDADFSKTRVRNPGKSNNKQLKIAKNPMIQKFQRKRGGFTLVEIMIVVAIIALLAAIAIPNFLRARKRSEATRILEDLRMLDSATDQYAIDNGKTTGFNPTFTDLQGYVKTGTVLYSTGADIFGDSYGGGGTGVFTVDTLPTIPANAWTTLSDVAPYQFWSPFHN